LSHTDTLFDQYAVVGSSSASHGYAAAVNATQLVGPATLFILMTIVGLELRLADFRRVAAAPRAIVVGTLAQVLLLPLMTWAVVAALAVPPVFGAGAVLVAVSPGAGASNILTALAGANTALSVSLTAMTSVLAVVTLPIIAALGMTLFLGDGVSVDVPVLSLIAQLTFSLLLPISLGMTLRARRPAFAARNRRRLQLLGGLAIASLIALAVAFGEEESLASFEQVQAGILAAAVWTLAAMAIGWGVASLLRLTSADRFTFVIEFGARNVAVAAIVGISALDRLDLTFFGAAYAIVGYPMIGVAALWWRRSRTSESALVPDG